MNQFIITPTLGLYIVLIRPQQYEDNGHFTQPIYSNIMLCWCLNPIIPF